MQTRENRRRVRLPGFETSLIRVARSMPGSAIAVEYIEPDSTVRVDPSEDLKPIPLDDAPIVQVAASRA